MSDSTPADFWDDKYRGGDYLYGTRPNAFLVDQSWRLNPGGRVLAVGDGEGRNGIWLSRQGHKVVSVDVSARALQKAAKLALDRGVRLSTICADLTDWDWPEAAYDAVVAIFLHLRPEARRTVHRNMLRALKPGGHVILEAFTPEQLRYGTGGPKDPAMLYSAGMLAEDFADAEIIELDEMVTRLSEGPGHDGDAAVVRLVARRR